VVKVWPLLDRCLPFGVTATNSRILPSAPAMALNVLSWNCAGGIAGKIDEVKQLINETAPDLLFISEAEFDDSISGYLNVADFRLDSAGTLALGKARIVCYIRDCVKDKIVRLKHLEGVNENIMVYGNKNVRICGLYRGFKNQNTSNPDPVGSLFECLNEICKFDGVVVVTGDFNIDPSRDKNTKLGKILANWSLENGLIQQIKKSTRRRIVNRASGIHLEESRLDLVYTNDLNVDSLSFPSINSDHDFLWTKLRAFGIKRATKKITVRDYSMLTSNGVKNFDHTRPIGLVELNTCLSTILNTLAPERVIRTRGPEQIINPRVEKLKKKRDRALKKFKKYGDEKYLKKS